ncbi:MAG: hypothetical protein RLZZ58_2242 [Pseudomonadota bacterium]|jgi:hypothetical protein
MTQPTAINFRPARTTGFWMAVAMAALQAMNAVRTLIDPVGFSAYMGLPVADAGPAAWVQVYGLRAAFIAILVTILLARRNFAALRIMTLAALVMPLGDAWLTAKAGASPAIIARHLATFAFLVIAAFFLSRAARQQTAAA